MTTPNQAQHHRPFAVMRFTDDDNHDQRLVDLEHRYAEDPDYAFAQRGHTRYYLPRWRIEQRAYDLLWEMALTRWVDRLEATTPTTPTTPTTED